MKDAHERKKDNEYRNAIERRKGELENRILENKLYSDSIELLEKVGFEKHAIKEILKAKIIEPMLPLQEHVFNGKITNVE